MAVLRHICFIIILIMFASARSSAQVNTELLRHDNMPDGLANTVSLDWNYESGNTGNLVLAAGYRSDYKTGRYYLFLDSELKYLESDGDIGASRAFVHFRVSANIYKYLAAEMFLQKNFNKPAKLLDRNLAGAGLRLPLLPADSIGMSAALGLGIMWEHEEYSPGYDRARNMMRSTNYLNIKYLAHSFKISVTGYYQVGLTKLDDYRVLSDITLAFRINDYLSFSSGVHYRFDNQPPQSVKNYDLEIRNGLKINF